MFKLRTIQSKTVTLIFTVFALFLSLDTIYEFNKIKSQSFKTLDKMNTTLNTLVVEFTSAYVYNQDIENLQRSIDAIKSDYVKSIYILNQEGKIIVQSNTPVASQLKHSKFDTLLHVKDNRIKNTKEYLILNTFKILDVPIGYMLLESDLQNYHQHVDEEITTLIKSALLWLVTFFILSLFIAKSLTRPIHKIIDRLRSTKDTEVLTFPNQPQKEFKFLSSNIATTHNRLRLSNENLESRVKEKTEELQSLNQSLEERIARAITEIEHKTSLLQQQSRLAQMGEMISMIAHQWRQPLGAISATAVNLKVKINFEMFDLKTQKGQKECTNYFLNQLNNIENYIQNLTATIDDFRNFYKPNKESSILTLEEVITKALSIIRSSLENAGIEILYNYQSQETLEMYDREMMQVILNILKNAQDNFQDKKTQNPQITITTHDKSIAICDNGGGIPQDVIEKIFDPYFSTKSEKNGTGLGLYMSKTIVEEHHNGHLHVSNQNGGVCFTIVLDAEIS